jgi:hypothetical protein
VVVEREFYASSNGDRWFLSRDEAGRAFVRHQANAPSGGQSTHIEVGPFLVRGPRAPEHEALLRLIGTLVGTPALKESAEPGPQ